MTIDAGFSCEHVILKLSFYIQLQKKGFLDPMAKQGTQDNPLRVAIVGAGPSGFYAAERLQKQTDVVVTVDMFDKLPTPFGLVRGGVAPDHDKIKSVTKVYDRIASKPGFRFFGNVEFGKDVTRADLAQHYHAIIYTVGAQSDRKLNIPGEDLAGSYPATDFVAWYNGHPEFRDCQFDLTQESVAVIGIGNVAMDVARILAKSHDELVGTDIADYALEALTNSNVKTIYVLGRRGPAQSKFTNPEIKELGELEDCEIIVDPAEVDLDPLSLEELEASGDKVTKRNVEILTEYAQRPPSNKSKKLVMRFLASPIELIGDEKIEEMKIVKNELYVADDGSLRPRASDQTETIQVGMVFRSVGYKGKPLADVPFYDRWGIIPNDQGRVLTAFQDGEQVIGDYVAGWIKRGPSGVIGTNKPCAVETVNLLLEDVAADKVLSPSAPQQEAIEALLKERGIAYVTYADWQILDQLEIEHGEAQGRPRVKFTRVDDMLQALKEHKAKALKERAG